MWFVYALLAAIFAALVSIAGKIALQGINPVFLTTARAIIMALFLILFSFSLGKFKEGIPELNTKTVVFLIISAVAGALSWLFGFSALKYARPTTVASIDKSSILFVILLSWLFLGEKITLKTVIGGILIFTGLILVQ